MARNLGEVSTRVRVIQPNPGVTKEEKAVLVPRMEKTRRKLRAISLKKQTKARNRKAKSLRQDTLVTKILNLALETLGVTVTTRRGVDLTLVIMISVAAMTIKNSRP